MNCCSIVVSFVSRRRSSQGVEHGVVLGVTFSSSPRRARSLVGGSGVNAGKMGDGLFLLMVVGIMGALIMCVSYVSSGGQVGFRRAGEAYLFRRTGETWRISNYRSVFVVGLRRVAVHKMSRDSCSRTRLRMDEYTKNVWQTNI